MAENRNLGWELLGFGLIVGGPVVGAVLVANRSPAGWRAFGGAAAKLWSEASRVSIRS